MNTWCGLLFFLKLSLEGKSTFFISLAYNSENLSNFAWQSLVTMRKNNSQNSYRQELRERILATAMNEFYTKGIKAVKMDDIAKRLSISKRTLY